MIFSKTCEYAIRALACLGAHKKGAFIKISEISDTSGVPGPYISKIFQSLARSGILKSQRGPIGGFAFGRDPKSLSLLEIVRAVDDLSSIEECIMGLDECSCDNPCPLHHSWKKAKEKILNELKKSTLAQVQKKIGNFSFRQMKRSRLKVM